MAVSGYFVFMEALDGGQYVSVPDITGFPIAEASFRLTESELELAYGKEDQVPHSTVPKYHIITQRPESGRVVRTGRKIHAIVSMGEDFLRAPDLLRMSVAEAEEQLRQSRFRLGAVARVPSSLPRDTVIQQDPAPGRSIPNQGGVSLLISAGSQRATAYMPDLRGMSVQEALQVMSSFGVTLTPREVSIAGAREDVVLDQDPPPDTLIYDGQMVTYEYVPSLEEDPAAVPAFSSTLRHEMDRDWFDKYVRVDKVDSRGVRETLASFRPAYDEDSRRQRRTGSTLRIPVSYEDEVTVEVYVENDLSSSYLLRGGADPIRK